jgi:hypothetical protein
MDSMWLHIKTKVPLWIVTINVLIVLALFVFREEECSQTLNHESIQVESSPNLVQDHVKISLSQNSQQAFKAFSSAGSSQTKSVFQDPCTIAPHLWPSSRVYHRCSSFLIGSCEMEDTWHAEKFAIDESIAVEQQARLVHARWLIHDGLHVRAVRRS